MKCPKCERELKYTKYGDWFEARCSFSPFCSQRPTYTKELPEGAKLENPYEGKTCYNCGAPAVRMYHGEWDEDTAYVCKDYPDC